MELVSNIQGYEMFEREQVFYRDLIYRFLRKQEPPEKSFEHWEDPPKQPAGKPEPQLPRNALEHCPDEGPAAALIGMAPGSPS